MIIPGFIIAIFFQAHLFGFAMRVEVQHRRGHAGANGQDIPDVESRNVSDEKINVVGAIDGAALANGVSGASFVGLSAEAVGGFDLDAEEAVSIVEDEVVALRAGWLCRGRRLRSALRCAWCSLVSYGCGETDGSCWIPNMVRRM